MQQDIFNEVSSRIKADYGFKDGGKWLTGGKCPSCNKKELFTNKESPWVLKCGRANKCGAEFHVKELYPDIFESWGKRFKPTNEQPNAAADAYMHYARGLTDKAFRAFYTQETYRDYNKDITSATVRFDLPNGGYWERIIDQPSRFDRKAFFKKGASYQGHWWQCPDQSFEHLAEAEDIWITEGIFDALMLRQHGLIAVSAMSTNNYPERALKALRKACGELNLATPRLVFAFDIGKAGTEYTKKYVARAIEDKWDATAAQPRPEGETDKLDWNDLGQRGRLTPQDIETYLWNGEVLLADNATEKAILLYEKHKWNSFSFVHDARTWWASFNAQKIKEIADKEGVTEKFAAKSAADVREIANCAFRILYFQRSEDIDESWYYLRVDSPSGKVAKNTFAPACLTAAAEFKKRLISVSPMSQFLGSTDQLDKLVSMQKSDVKVVEALDFIGYSKDHETYVLNGYAVNRGRVIEMNEDDYFDLGKHQLKLRSRAEILSINYDTERFDTSWVEAYWIAFSKQGMVTLTFMIMSLFAEQIRSKQTSLGFLEMSGIPGAGKSTALVFLWKLFGRRDYEGFDPSKSSLAGRMRNLARTANIPVVFMEADRSDNPSHFAKFDWDEIKPLFGGQIGRETGVKNGGTETYSPKFKASLIIEQNASVAAAPAVMERIMQTTWDKSGWSMATKEAATRIENWEIDDLSGTIIHLIKREAKYLETYFAAFPQYEPLLAKKGVRNGRVRLCHAQLHAGLDALAALIKLPPNIIEQMHDHITKIALDRDLSLESDHPVVVKFWEAYDYLIEREELKRAKDHTGDFKSINRHRKSDELIAVKLVEFEAHCRDAGISMPTIDELKKHLKTSKSRPYVDAKTVNGVGDDVAHCWIFKQPTETKGA